jgi:excisionase family DNA binding protein
MNRTTLTAEETAKYIGVSYWKLLELVKSNEIPNVKIGRRILFRIATLENWMLNQETSSLEEEVKEMRKLSIL